MGGGVEPQTIEQRVERLQERVAKLDELPASVDGLTGQILHLRDEVGVEFSAVRGEMRTMGEELRGEMKVMGEELRGEMRAMRHGIVEELRENIGEMHQLTVKEVLSFRDEVIWRLQDIQDRLPRKKSR